MASGLLLTEGLDGAGAPFEPLALRQQAFDEAWLRDLLIDEPDLIPIEEAFPGTRGLSTVCTELPLSDGGSSLVLDVFGVALSGSITAALLPDDGGETANLVWSRKRA